MITITTYTKVDQQTWQSYRSVPFYGPDPQFLTDRREEGPAGTGRGGTRMNQVEAELTEELVLSTFADWLETGDW